MDIIELAQNIHPGQQLSQYQKDLLWSVQKAKEENKILFVSFGRNIGRTMVTKIIDEFEKQN